MVVAAFAPADICKQLNGFGYKEHLSDKLLSDVLNSGIQDPRFTNLLVWLCNEISVLYELDERLQFPGDKPDDFECYLLELSSLLNELECPFDELSSGPLLERFGSPQKLQKLLTFLISHLRCARLTALDRLKKESEKRWKREEVICVEKVLKCLGSTQPPAGLTSEQLFKKICELVKTQFAKCKQKPKPLFTASLTEHQWEKVEKINERLVSEYHCRMQVLLKRLDVTIQSFVWSDRIKKIEDKVYDVYRPSRDSIVISANVQMSDLLAATTDLLVVEKIMSSKQKERTASRLNKVLMAERPGDRGGRPSELRAPPPEMPSWKKERAPEISRGGRQGGGYNRGGGDYQSRGNYNRDAGFENQVMQEYEAANRRQQGGGYFAQGYQGEYDGHGYAKIDNYGQRGRGGYRGGRGGGRGYGRY